MTNLAFCGVAQIFPSWNKLVDGFAWFAFSAFSRPGVMTLRDRYGAETDTSHFFELISHYIHDRQETKENQILWAGLFECKAHTGIHSYRIGSSLRSIALAGTLEHHYVPYSLFEQLTIKAISASSECDIQVLNPAYRFSSAGFV